MIGPALVWNDIKPVLKKVSRSFYLSLWILPKKSRTLLALAYLLARSADTISDTLLIPSDRRLHWLLILKKNIQTQTHQSWNDFTGELIGPQEIMEEKELLKQLPWLVDAYWQIAESDREEIKKILVALIFGMEEDLRRFPENSPDHIQALVSFKELDNYCYYAAGVVGPFWTRMLLHSDCEKLESLSIDYGKGLQLINIVKDVARDYQNGRCYFPLEGLNHLSLSPRDIGDPHALPRLKPLVHQLIGQSLKFLESAQQYVMALPRWRILARLSSLWPMWIGLDSLEYLAQDDHLLNPNVPHKISRRSLSALLRRSCWMVLSQRALQRYFLQKQKRILTLIASKTI
jgi:farnesyl-diphosphate farnesyltransferase